MVTSARRPPASWRRRWTRGSGRRSLLLLGGAGIIAAAAVTAVVAAGDNRVDQAVQPNEVAVATGLSPRALQAAAERLQGQADFFAEQGQQAWAEQLKGRAGFASAASEEAILRDLVNRGLVPRQAIAAAPVAAGSAGVFGELDPAIAVAIGSSPAASAASEEAILQDLVNRGLVPRQALQDSVGVGTDAQLIEQATRLEQALRREALAASSPDAVMRDLVNRGLVPRQALEEAPTPGRGSGPGTGGVLP